MGLCLPYRHTHHKNHTYGIGLATCIKSCMCSCFRPVLSHEAYVFHARSMSGFCFCQLHLEESETRSLGHSCFWGLGALSLLSGGSFRAAPKRSQTIPNDAETGFRQRIEPTNETGHVEFADSQSVWSREKQQAKQV